MAGVLQHRAAFVAVLAALAATAYVFAFARPEYRDPNAGPQVDLATVTHHTVRDVRHAFALQGIFLRYETSISRSVVMLGDRPKPWPTNDLYVYVGGRKGTVGWGARDKTAYEAQFDNLLVHDGRSGPRELDAVEAAVASLR